ncbi:MAG: transcriptional repressor [Anaerolineales bacterium]|nr:transcriptional repressor [Anaerolineales bacterium]
MNQKSSKAHEWLRNLQANGYRATNTRRAVVETLANSQHALSPLEIYEICRSQHKRMGLVTVYRTVEKLEELGLVQRVHQPSGCQAFISAAEGHQHLLICQSCGKVTFFNGENEAMESLMKKVSLQSGYQIESHWLQLFGQCANCRDQT